MQDINKLQKRLEELADGYISIKNISNKKYYYLKYYVNGKQISKYINKNEIEKIENELKERKQIEQQIKAYEKKGKNLSTLSNNAQNLTGSIMLGDTKVAIYEEGELTYINEKLCPLLIKRTHNLREFLKGRVIDSNRTNSRLLKKVLNIKTKSDELISLLVYAAVITDNYWFKPRGSKLKYKDISFDNDYYSDLALKGELTVYPKISKHTPQLTIIGNFEKCWKKINNEWWLYKKGTNEQIFSEMFCSLLAKKLNIPTAIYEYDDGYIKTKNFVDKYNFEPMLGLVGDDEDYGTIFEALFNIDVDLADRYLMLLFFDCLVNNIDRHNENLGFLRDRKTGKIVSLAPNFDNNLALLGYDKNLIVNAQSDGFIKFFIKFLKNNKNAYQRYRDLEIGTLNKQKIEDCLNNIPIKLEEYDITKYILNRYDYLLSIKNK